MAITDWPVSERPRERLLHLGAGTLSDAELLAILLGSGTAGSSAVDLARQVLGRFGGLRAFFTCDQETFIQTPGLGPARYAQIHAMLELGLRHLAERMQRTNLIDSPAATRQFLHAWLRDHPREAFACVFLDNRHRVVACEALFQGTIDGASVYPREVVRRCLELRASALIFAHNHPSGVAEPSDADRRITRRLIDALALIDVRVLDHLVVGDGEMVSFAERGLI
jgi:DNA repair protein RadC